MRRATSSVLAPISASDFNSRAGAGPSKVAKRTTMGAPAIAGRPSIGFGKQSARMSSIPVLADAGRKSSISGRKSSLGGRKSSMSGVRRSSVYGGRGGGKSDPRPVSDVNFRNSCIRDVIQYLTANGYDHSISPKVLNSPSGKDFNNIVTFLFKKMIPNFKFSGRPEEEIPVLCKQIGYPFAISKSTLSAVGTPHTWPTLLAFLQWMVELLEYRSRMDEDMVAFDDFESKNTVKFESVVKHYTRFMAGQDTLEEDLALEFTQRNTQIQQDILALESELQVLSRDLEVQTAAQPPLAKLKTQRDTLQVDREKFRQLLENLGVHKTQTLAKVQEMATQARSKEAELAEAEAEAKSLRSQVAGQVLSVEDVERMSRDRQQAEAALGGLTKRTRDLQLANWTASQTVTDRTAEIEEMMAGYSERVRLLKMPQHLMRDATGKPINLSLQVAGYTTTRPTVFLQDIPSTVSPALSQLKHIAIQQVQKRQEGLFKAEEDLERLEEKLSELGDQKTSLERQIKRHESAQRVEKQRMERAEELMQQEIEAKEAELERLRTALLDTSEGDDCEVLSKQLEQMKAQHREEAEAATRQVAALQAVLLEHTSRMQAVLAAAHTAAQRTAQHIAHSTPTL